MDIVVLGTSQRRYTMDVFLGHIEDVHRTFLQSFKNKQQLSFNYFTQTKNNTTVMCFILCLKLTSWGGPKDVTMQTSL